MKSFIPDKNEVLGFANVHGITDEDAYDLLTLQGINNFLTRGGDTRTAVFAIGDILERQINRRCIKANKSFPEEEINNENYY